MRPEHKAIIARANKESLQPSEIASELLLHDLVQACINQLSKHEVGFRKMSEKQQDAAISELQSELKASTLLAARLIAGANTATVEMTLKDLKVSNGTVTGIVKSTEEHFNDLISKVQDKSDVLIVLYERDYFDALEAIESDKDQKSLPLDEAQPAKRGRGKAKAETQAKPAGEIANQIAGDSKPVEVEPELLDKAREFVSTRRVPTIAGVQNVLSVGFAKGKAILEALAAEGVVVKVEGEGDDVYQMPPLANTNVSEQNEGAEGNAPADPDTLSDELYEQIKQRVIETQEVVASGLAVFFDISIHLADAAVDRLEMEGVISTEDEMGGREIYDQP